MGYYDPLTRFLEGCRPSEAVLRFREIEDIIGRNLPASARKHQAWWANTTSHSHAEAWLRLNWKTSKVDLAGERVTFARSESGRVANAAGKPDGVASEGASVIVDLDRLSVAGRRLVNDYAADLDGDMAAAVARAVHEAAIARRGRLIDQIVANAPRMPPGEPDSVQLIREDRDAH